MLDNDANAIALGERGGELQRLDDLLVLKASTGLGAGIIAGGVLQRGATQAAGEFGHNKTAAAARAFVPMRRHRLPGGDRSGWAVVHQLQQQGRAVRHMRDVVELVHAGDPEARRLIRDSGRHIGEVIASAVNLLNPAVLVVAGDMAAAYDVFVAGLRETLYRNATAMATRELQVVPAAHEGHSAVIGTAAMVLDQVLSARAVGRPHRLSRPARTTSSASGSATSKSMRYGRSVSSTSYAASDVARQGVHAFAMTFSRELLDVRILLSSGSVSGPMM